jgi:hypothetical protein
MIRRRRRIRNLANRLEALEPRHLFAGPGDDGGDTRVAATALPFAYGVAGRFADAIGRPEDVDIFQLDLRAGDHVELTLESTSTGEFPFLGVLRAFGESTALDASQEHRLTFTAAASGMFHVGVSGFGNDQYDPDQYDESLFGFTGDYRLDFTVTSTSPGDPPTNEPPTNEPDPNHPPQNDPPTDPIDDPIRVLPPAPVAPRDEKFEGRIASAGETSEHTLVVTESSWLDARVVNRAGGALAATLTLHDATGAPIATSADGQLTQHVAAGSYTLTVRATTSTPLDYQLTAKLSKATSPLDDFLTGDGVSALATGDFTGDGLIDAVVANTFEGTLTFLIGLGDGAFAPQTPFTVGSAPTALQAADFTGDGVIDLAVALRDSDRVVLYTGGANGWFASVHEFTVGAGATALAAADFNGDGAVDLAVALGNTNSIQLLTNLSATPTSRTVTLPSAASSLIAQDLNGDGRADLAASLGASNQVAVLEQNADGAFTSRTLTVTGQPSEITAADFDLDGDLDLAIGLAESGNVALAARDTNGNYAITTIAVDLDRKVSSSGSALRTVVRAADFNADGRIDLAVANTFSRDLAILLNGPNGLAPRHRVQFANAIVALAAADVNADGRVDLIAANDDADTAGVAVRRGRGNGSFQQVASLPVGTDPHALAAADFNSDGLADLVSTSFNGLTIQLGTGDGAFAAPIRIAADQAQAVITGDFNRDGRPDLAATFPFQGANSQVDHRLGVWLGLGDGTFRDAAFYDVGELPLDLVAADFDDDGALDLATANGASNDVSILLNTGDGTFTLVATLPAGTQPTSIVAADFNADGLTDLAAANEQSDNVSLFRGQRDGQFTLLTTLTTGDAPIDLLAADLDADGRLDLVTADHAAGALSFFYQEANGVFTRESLSSGAGARSVAFLATSDSTPSRLAVTLDASDRLLILESDSPRTWNRTAEFATGRTPIALVASDLNQDERDDLAVLNAFTNDVTLLFSSGDDFTTSSINSNALTESTPTFSDLNGDGALDALVVRQSGEVLLRLGRLDTPGTFDAPLVVNAGRPALAAEVFRTATGLRIATLDRTGNRLSLYRLAPNGETQLDEELVTLAGATRFTTGDLDGDNLDDLAIATRDGRIQTFVAALNGSWQTQFLSTGSLSPAKLMIVDADNRAGGDLVLADSDAGEVRLFLNQGQGAFAAPLVYRVGAGPYHLAPVAPNNLAAFTALANDAASAQRSLEGTSSFTFGDFDGDALPDLLALNAGSNTFALLTGGGANGLNAASTFLTGDRPTEAAVGDFNRDGRADLAVLLAGEARIAIYLGDGAGGFTPGETYLAGNLPRGLAALDVDADGLVDLIVGNAFGDLMTYRGHGDGTFGAFLRAGSEIPLAVADLDGDGIPEVIVANESLDRVSVQQTDGAPTADGALTANQIFAQQRAEGLLAPGAVEMADLNADGRADMLVANRGGNELLVYLGRGDGTFDAARSFYAGTNPAGITIHDVNRDGRLDVVVANAGSNDVSVLLGDANDLLRPGPRLAVGNAPVATEADDYNGDGQIDLLVANSGADNVSLLFGVGGGFFDDTQAIVFPTGADPRTLLVGQFDSSAGIDLVTVNARGGSLTFYSNFVSGSLNSATISTGGLRPTSAVARDFDLDGRLDVVVANNASGSLSLLLGGEAGLSLSAVIDNLGFNRPSSLELVDFGGETGLRLLVTHEGDEQPHLFTPKDFLPRPGERTEPAGPLGPNSGLLLTLFQSGVRVVASSIVALPTFAPGVSEFFAQLLGNDFGGDLDDGGIVLDETERESTIWKAAEFIFHGLEETFEGLIAAWNITFQAETAPSDWLHATESALAWFLGDASNADEGAALAQMAKAVVQKLDAAAADIILAETEPLPLAAPEVAPMLEDEPGQFPESPARAMTNANSESATPITPAMLEQPIDAQPTVVPTIPVAAPLATTNNETTWPWQLWGAAAALGTAALGAGGYAARKHWTRRRLELLGEE